VLGALPGSPVRFEIPATGDRPMRFGATDLPAGLTLDPATGWITGACAQPGDYLVTLQAANAVGRDEKPLRLVIGDLTALTPPMVWNEPAAGSEAGANRRAEEARARSLLAEHGWSSAAAREAEDAAKRGTATPSGGATAETTAGAAAGVIGGGGPGATAAPAASAASGAQVADESEDSWQSMATIGFIQSRRHPQARPGQWQELAPLWVGWIGPADARRPTRLTPDEQSTQLSLWCLLAAPLRLRCDLARLDGFTVSLVTNDEVLALDQDPLGRPATLIARDEAVQTWARPLADGSIAVGFFNLGLDPAAGSLQWSELDLTGPQIVRDLWRQRDLGAYTDRFDAPVTPHGVFLFRLRPAP
jgi:hypothetical protein